jgi:hypothetical protein
VGLKHPNIRRKANTRSNSHKHGWEISVTLTQSAISFSEKQQISKSEYLRTQQLTFTHRMGKSDKMHGVYGAQGILLKKQLLMQGYFVKYFIIFKVRHLPREKEVFQNRIKSPRLNHLGISVVSSRFLFSKTATRLLIHHSTRLNARHFKTIFQNILKNKTLIIKSMP